MPNCKCKNGRIVAPELRGFDKIHQLLDLKAIEPAIDQRREWGAAHRVGARHRSGEALSLKDAVDGEGVAYLSLAFRRISQGKIDKDVGSAAGDSSVTRWTSSLSHILTWSTAAG